METAEETTAQASEETKAEDIVTVVSNVNGVVISHKVFASDKLNGLASHFKSYESIDAAVNDIGPDAVLNAINSKVQTGLYMKALNALPTFKDDDDGSKLEEWREGVINNGNTPLVTEQEASSWQPGQRATKGFGGYQKDFFAAKKALVEAIENEADEEEIEQLRTEAKVAKRLMDEAWKKLQAEDDELGLD